MFSAKISKTGDGFTLLVNNPLGVPLRFDTVQDRLEREEVMNQVVEQLTQFSRDRWNLHYRTDDDTGDFILEQWDTAAVATHDTHQFHTFTVTFFTRDEGVLEADRVPDSWKYVAQECKPSLATGGSELTTTSEAEGDMKATLEIITAAHAWYAEHVSVGRPAASTPQQHNQDATPTLKMGY